MEDQQRTLFRTAIFTRDNHTCIVPSCGKPAVDAHHIIERRLWNADKEKGGYFVDNGVSLCEEHHKLAEKNVLLPQVLRMYARITNRVLPQQLNPNNEYNKWGEVLKPLKQIYLYKDAVKYPSSSYFAFSPNLVHARETNPIVDLNDFIGFPLVITIKMDGSNVTMTNKYIAARNGTDARHRSFDYCKSLHSRMKDFIPDHIQVFGEWLYAKHSINYIGDLALSSYLQIFGLYDKNYHVFLGWNEVENMARKIGCITVPVLAVKTFDDIYQLTGEITRMGEDIIAKGQEGTVVRSMYPFHYSQFPQYLAKYVRAHHVQTDKHWKTGPIIKNELKE